MGFFDWIPSVLMIASLDTNNGTMRCSEPESVNTFHVPDAIIAYSVSSHLDLRVESSSIFPSGSTGETVSWNQSR